MITETGDLIELKDVLYIPQVPSNVFSPGKQTDIEGYHCRIYSGHTEIWRDSKIVAKGKKENKTVYLKFALNYDGMCSMLKVAQAYASI